jgi:hypothetical protein
MFEKMFEDIVPTDKFSGNESKNRLMMKNLLFFKSTVFMMKIICFKTNLGTLLTYLWLRREPKAL